MTAVPRIDESAGTGCIFCQSQQPPSPTAPAPGLSRRDHGDTARAAALAAWPKTGTQRAQVLAALARFDLTDEQIQRWTALPANTERPRRVELVRGGWVTDSGQRRKTEAGLEAVVWTLTDKARQQIGEAA